jgi:hypothetical protein
MSLKEIIEQARANRNTNAALNMLGKESKLKNALQSPGPALSGKEGTNPKVHI